MAKRKRDPVTNYASDVVDGKVVAGELVRLACQRHLTDLEVAGDRGLRFIDTAAQRAIDFFGFLKHSKGEWAGRSFELTAWQKFIVGSLFGWLRADDARRYRIAYVQLGRKNGKSTLAAGIGLYLFFADGEPGAEVYSAATKKDQAIIVHAEATRMVKASDALSSRIRIYKNNLNVEATNSKYEPIGADEDTLDGLNVHGAIIDELHAHKTRGVVDVLETATGARRQPLQFEITTAGYAKISICREHREYSEKVLRGIIADDTWFAYVAELDQCEQRCGGCEKCDDWRDPAAWPKANPNWGISVKPDDMLRLFKKAIETPAAQNSFRRLRLDQWTEQDVRWMPLDRWDACADSIPDDLAGRECFGGLDLSSTLDLTAWVMVFPGDRWDVLCRFFVPAENARKRADTDRVPYPLWIQHGLIEATEGDVIDYDVVRERIREDGKRYNIREIAFDRWNATQLVNQLQGDGFTMVATGMGFASLSAPTKELMNLVLAGKLRHGGNAVLRWNASNVTVEQDAAGNEKPSKKKSSEKIDGIVALILAISRAMLNRDDAGAEVGLSFL